MINHFSALCHPDELDVWIERAQKLRLDSIGLHPVGGGGADRSLAELVELNKTPRQLELYKRLAELGIKLEFQMHAARYLMPASLFGEHPDWFRVNGNGVRCADFNFCVSNPDALATFASNAAALAQILPNTDGRCYFWLDDTDDARCHCEKCEKLSASDQQLIAVNAMAKAIRAVKPDAKVAYLCYAAATDLPTIKPEEGVFLEIAVMNREHDKPLCDPTSERNMKSIKNLPALLDYFGRENSVSLNYWTDNSMFSGWRKPPKPLPFRPDIMAEDVKYFESLGVEGLTAFACYLGGDYVELYGEPDLSGYKLR